MFNTLKDQKKQVLRIYSDIDSIEKSKANQPLLDSDVPLANIIKFIEMKQVSNQLVKSQHSSGLVQKKVAIKKKDGSTYWAYRWVDPTTGSAKQINHKKYNTDDVEGKNDDEKIHNVVHGNHSPTDKIRKLVSLGIYSKKHLDELSETKYKDSQYYLKNEAGIDHKDYQHDGSDLPSEVDKNNPNTLNKPEVQKMAIAEIASKLGSKEAFKVQKEIKDEIMKKYNITVEDKWEGYEDDLNMLLDGTLGLRAVMGYGTGGVGKTYTLESKILPGRKLIEFDPELDMEKGGEEYDYVKIGGKIGSKEVQRLMYEHRNKILIFDDCDSMWKDPGVINVLKNALDTSGKGKTQWAMPLSESGKDKGDAVPSSFTFGGRMIFITNLTKQELVDEGAAAVVESRCASSDLTMNLEQTLDRLEKIAPSLTLKDENRNVIEDITLEDKLSAFKAFKEVSHLGRIDQVNTRVLTQIVAKARLKRIQNEDPEKIHEYLVKQVLKQFGY